MTNPLSAAADHSGQVNEKASREPESDALLEQRKEYGRTLRKFCKSEADDESKTPIIQRVNTNRFSRKEVEWLGEAGVWRHRTDRFSELIGLNIHHETCREGPYHAAACKVLLSGEILGSATDGSAWRLL